jgi:hypothetical protein
MLAEAVHLFMYSGGYADYEMLLVVMVRLV